MEPYNREVMLTRSLQLSPHPAALKATAQLLGDCRANLADITHAVSLDPILTAKILQAGNSSYYGVKARVDNIPMAFVILGLDGAIDIIESFNLVSEVSDPVDQAFLSEFTEHSLKVAALCRALAVGLGYKLHGSEYFAGLLHDLGQVAIRVSSPEHYLVLEQHGEPMQLGIERTLIGTSHCEVGKYLGEQWNLPPVIVESMGSHHQPIEGDTEFSVPALVRLAVFLLPYLENHTDENAASQVLPDKHFMSSSFSLADVRNVFCEIRDISKRLNDSILSE